MNIISKSSRVFSFSDIKRKFDSKKITAEVDYQRQDGLWGTPKKTLFIESVYWNLPVPPVYVWEREDGTWEIIDGQQRLKTIKEYLSGDKRVLNKKYFEIPESEDKIKEKFDYDIDGDEYNEMMDKSIVVEIIHSTNEEWIKFELFTRLNRGSVKLSAQELRRVLFRSKYNENLSKKITDISNEGRFSEFFSKRKNDEEIFFRFIWVYKFIKNCSLQLDNSAKMIELLEKSTLTFNEAINGYMRALKLKEKSENFKDTIVKMDSIEYIDDDFNIFKNAIEKVQTSLGQDAFKIPSFDPQNESDVNDLEEEKQNVNKTLALFEIILASLDFNFSYEDIKNFFKDQDNRNSTILLTSQIKNMLKMIGNFSEFSLKQNANK